MRMTGVVGGMLALLTMPTAAAQNTEIPTLAGLRSFTIAISGIDDEDATKCAVTRTGMYSSLRSVLAQSDIAITDNAQARDGIVYLQVTVLSNCTANIVLNVQTPVTIAKTGQRLYAPVWERSRLRTGFSGRSAGAAITRSVEETAQQLVDDWNSANE